LPLYRPGQFTWRSRSLGAQFTEALDHILYDDSVEPLNAFAMNRGNSDHIPVVAHFEASRAWPAFDPAPSTSDQ
jgi:endonuclease/exonuclease/phosphatase (EEP) superfamily protein YafD